MQQQKKHRAKATLTGFTLILLLLGGAGITGCSDSGKPTAPQTPASGKPKQQVITQGTATVSAEKSQVVYSYNPMGRRDPFSPIIVREERKAQSEDRPPLERYNIYEFKLTGIVWGGFGYNAMLEGVRTGAIIGQNKGVVKKISKDAMVIEEKFKTISGETDRKEIVIELRKKQEGMQ
jgi:type IV pilus assembly protein PilP